MDNENYTPRVLPKFEVEQARNTFQNVLSRIDREYKTRLYEVDEMFSDEEKVEKAKNKEVKNEKDKKELNAIKKELNKPYKELIKEGREIRNSLKGILINQTLETEKTVKENVEPVLNNIKEKIDAYEEQKEKERKEKMMIEKNNKIEEQEFEFVEKPSKEEIFELEMADFENLLEQYKEKEAQLKKEKEEEDLLFARIAEMNEKNLILNKDFFKEELKKLNTTEEYLEYIKKSKEKKELREEVERKQKELEKEIEEKKVLEKKRKELQKKEEEEAKAIAEENEIEGENQDKDGERFKAKMEKLKKEKEQQEDRKMKAKENVKAFIKENKLTKDFKEGKLIVQKSEDGKTYEIYQKIKEIEI